MQDQKIGRECIGAFPSTAIIPFVQVSSDPTALSRRCIMETIEGLNDWREWVRKNLKRLVKEHALIDPKHYTHCI